MLGGILVHYKTVLPSLLTLTHPTLPILEVEWPSWDLNYPALVSLMNGQYYVEYHAIFGMTGIPVMSEATWNKAIGWLGKHVNEITEITCEQVRQKIVSHGEKILPDMRAPFQQFFWHSP